MKSKSRKKSTELMQTQIVFYVLTITDLLFLLWMNSHKGEAFDRLMPLTFLGLYVGKSVSKCVSDCRLTRVPLKQNITFTAKSNMESTQCLLHAQWVIILSAKVSEMQLFVSDFFFLWSHCTTVAQHHNLQSLLRRVQGWDALLIFPHKTSEGREELLDRLLRGKHR